jgi:hypothetical protein
METPQILAKDVDDDTQTSSKPDETDEVVLNIYEKVLIMNDDIIFELTSCLKERYELRGFLNNCNMNQLLDIFYNNMIVEEVHDVCMDEDDLESDDDFPNY